MVVNLGDIVGYGASPNEVIERVRGLGTIFVRGNHDKAASGAMELKDFNPIAGLAALWTRETLTPENLKWLRALPEGPLQVGELPGVQFVHGSPVDEDEYVVTLRDAIEPLLTSATALTFFGHTHLQGCFSTNNVANDYLRPQYNTVGQAETIEFPLKGKHALPDQSRLGRPTSRWRLARRIRRIRFERPRDHLRPCALQPEAGTGTHPDRKPAAKTGYSPGRRQITTSSSHVGRPLLSAALEVDLGFVSLC